MGGQTQEIPDDGDRDEENVIDRSHCGVAGSRWGVTGESLGTLDDDGVGGDAGDARWWGRDEGNVIDMG